MSPKLRTLDFVRTLTLIAALTSTSGAFALRVELPDRLELVGLLQTRQFDRLASTLDTFQTGFESGSLAEAGVEAAFMAFANSQPVLENRLNDWVDADPADYRARAARGVYFWNLGILSRGARQTASRSAQSKEFFEAALRDLALATDARPALTVGYSLLIHIAIELDQQNIVEELHREAQRRAPMSLLVERRYLDSLRPLGSQQTSAAAARLEQLARYVDRFSASAHTNTNVSPLSGYADLVRADLLAGSQQRQAAMAFYDRAVEHGDYWLYHYRRGLNRLRLDQALPALEDLNTALLQRPQAPRLLNARGRILLALGRTEEAIIDWQQALEANPFDPVILLHYSFALRDEQRIDEALNALNRALEYGSENPHVWDARGRMLLYDRHDYAGAEQNLSRAIELEPASARHRFNHAAALYKDKACEAPQAFGYYLSLCESQQCPAENVGWVEQWQAAFDESQRCDRLEAERNIDRQKREGNE